MSRFRLFVVALLATIVVIAILFYVRVRRTEELITKRTETVVDTTTLVTRVRDLARLETAGMHVVNVSTIRQGYQLVPDRLAGDSLTLWSEGDVIAGVDLSRITDRDVRHDPDGGITLVLPPAEILVTRVDNRATHVMHRDTGFFRSADPGLEGRARAYAERAIRDEALRRGILPRASTAAETKLGGFIHELGFSKVRFVESGTRKAGG